MKKIILIIILLFLYSIANADDKSSRVTTSVTSFNNNLSSSDTTVQRALDTIDNLSIGGTSVILDLADDGSNESLALAEIATSGDTNSIFTEPTNNKLLITLSNDWPKADTADDLTCTNCIGSTEISDDNLDYIDFEDTMDLDASLILNMGTSNMTWNLEKEATIVIDQNGGLGISGSSQAMKLVTGSTFASDIFVIDTDDIITITNGINITTTAGAIINGINLTASGINNAITIGSHTILGTTGTIDFTDFDVNNDGKITLAPDNAGDAISISSGATDMQALVYSDTGLGTNVNTAGIIDLNLTPGNAAVDGINISLFPEDGVAGTDYEGIVVTLNSNGGDEDLFGLTISGNAGATLSAGIYEAFIKLENAENTVGAVTDAILINSTSGIDGDVTDAIDVSNSNIVNAINVGPNIIIGTTSAIEFTDFNLSNDGIMTFTSDIAGDQINITAPAGDHQALVVDVDTNANTSTEGIIDLNIGAGNAAIDGINVNLIMDNGAAAAQDYEGMVITMQADDADGDMIGIRIVGQATTNAAAGSYEAGIFIDNAENTSAAMTDGILITSSGNNNGITDGIDVSASNINNAINIGSNDIEGGIATISFTDFRVSADGLLSILSDSGGDTITITPSAAITDALDASDSLIVNALNAGGNIILGTTAEINFDNFDLNSSGDILMGDRLETIGTAPSLSSCGTTPSISTTATDSGGKITVGSGTVTSCTLTFVNAWTNEPSCNVSNGTAVSVFATTTTTTLILTSGVVSIDADVIMYNCFGQQ